MTNRYTRFRHLAIDSAKPAPTEQHLAVIEGLLGARLPRSFREFLGVANGGYLEYVLDVPISSGKTEPLGFCSVFSTENVGSGSFIAEMKSAQERGAPIGVLPFARDGGGSTAYLDLSREGKGRVVAFVLGLPEWTGLRTKSMYVELARSFDEYVDKLRIDRDAALDHLAYDATTPSHVDAIEEWLEIGMPSWQKDGELVNALRDARLRVTRQSDK